MIPVTNVAAGIVITYRPVVVLHGIVASDASMAGFVNYIQTAHPGTQVLNVDGYNDLVSSLLLRCLRGAAVYLTYRRLDRYSM